MYKQIIIARRDLKMSPGKLAAQVSHGSMAFLTSAIKNSAVLTKPEIGIGKPIYYNSSLLFDQELYEEWIQGSFTKIVLEAKNRDKLLRAADLADSLDMVEGIDYFCIFDNCCTELTPEEPDGTTLTCIGFRPMDNKIIDQIGKEYHLF